MDWRSMAGIAAAIWNVLAGTDLASAQQQPASQAQAISQAKPRVPPGRDPGGTAVAVIGHGVNYLLSQIADRLARDGEGDVIGLDLSDGDGRPLERAGQYPGLSHTALASVILREAGATRLVPVRTKPGDATAHGKAAVLVARSPAAIALIAYSSSKREEWEPFRQVAEHFRHVLFIIPAGDDGQDLDSSPSYPASLGTGNLVVVAAVDGNGRAVQRSNRGVKSIDVAIPVEGIEATGTNGETLRLGGSYAAAARLAALAARLIAVEPSLRGTELKQKILSQAKPLPGASHGRGGWIPDAQRLFRTE